MLLGTKITLAVGLGIVTTATAAIVLERNAVREQGVEMARQSMRNAVIQAEEVRRQVSAAHEAGAYDKQRLLQQAEQQIAAGAEGVMLATSATEQLDTVTQLAMDLGTVFAEIDEASQRQTAGVTQSAGSVGQISDVTQQTAAGAEQSAAAAHELQKQGQLLQQAAGDLSSMIERRAA
jgi:methyl-accepting chemotaxis protein